MLVHPEIKLRPIDQRLGNFQTTHHAARKSIDHVIFTVGQFQEIKHFLDALLSFFGGIPYNLAEIRTFS